MRHLGARGRWLLLVLPAAAACNGILDIEPYPRGVTPAAEPAFVYADENCKTCIEQSCRSEQDACEQDADCRLLQSGLAGCAPDDLNCRAVLIHDARGAVDSPAYLDLDRCRRDHCLDPCLGTGGLAEALFDASCGACAQDKCEELLLACLGDADCEKLWGCASRKHCDDPECIFECYYAQDVARASAELANDLENCIGDCRDTGGCVGIGTTWACLDDGFSWGQPDVGTDTVDLSIALSVYDKTARPAAGVSQSACNLSDADCLLPKGTSILDDEGEATITITQLDMKTGWSGFLRVEGEANGEAVFPEDFYLGRPLTRSEPVSGFVLREADALLFGQSVGHPLVPDTGHLGIVVRDCLTQRASGLRFAPGAWPSDGDVFYYSGGLPSLVATATDKGGEILVLNLEPSDQVRWLELVDENTLEPRARAEVRIRPNRMSGVFVWPIASD